MLLVFFFFSSRRRHTRCALVTGVQTCALPILLQQIGRGLYKLADAPIDSGTSLAEAARIQPRGVICLLSALQFHELTTQTPHMVWMMLGQKDWAPGNASVALQ